MRRSIFHSALKIGGRQRRSMDILHRFSSGSMSRMKGCSLLSVPTES